jgi:cytochrome c oxidase assembly protein subunit 11
MSTTPSGPKHLSNRLLAMVLLAFFAGMVGMAYASVPLYRVFCQVTGYGGTTQRATQYSDRVLDQKITVRFDANVAGVPWEFEPEQRQVTMPIGETVQVAFRARNETNRTTSGRASFNVTPQAAGAYFMKVECFCFTDNTLKPGEQIDMPVVFYVDPDIVDAPETKNIHTLTLSYTFYPTETERPVAQAEDSQEKNKPNAEPKIGG